MASEQVCKHCGDAITSWLNSAGHNYWSHVPNGKSFDHIAEPSTLAGEPPGFQNVIHELVEMCQRTPLLNQDADFFRAIFKKWNLLTGESGNQPQERVMTTEPGLQTRTSATPPTGVVEPALNALSLDALQDLQVKISVRISELTSVEASASVGEPVPCCPSCGLNLSNIQPVADLRRQLTDADGMTLQDWKEEHDKQAELQRENLQIAIKWQRRAEAAEAKLKAAEKFVQSARYLHHVDRASLLALLKGEPHDM